MKYKLALFCLVLLLASFETPRRGDIIDSFNGVVVYYNGSNYKNVSGRNVTNDGYNLGLKYQCVEFVKRYYLEIYHHKMPNSYGNAREYFDKSIGDKAFNSARGLMQYRNVRTFKPEPGDLLIYDSYPGNPFGHLAIITEVGEDYVKIIQQNTGRKTREKLKLVKFMEYYTIADYDILGWLRKE
jgi:hypothetical protein